MVMNNSPEVWPEIEWSQKRTGRPRSARFNMRQKLA